MKQMAIGKGIHSLIPPKNQSHNSGKEPFVKRAIEASIPEREKEKQHALPRQDSIFQIEIEKIVPNPYQPRKSFKNEDIEDLARSIREYGMLQPIVVTKTVKETDMGTDVEYQLVAGERRLMAAKVAGMERVPAVIRKIDTGKEKLEISLIENIQRSDLNPIECAKAYARLQDEFGLTQREISVRVGKSRESVANTMRLLSLPAKMLQALTEGKINESQGRALLSISDLASREKTFERILSGEWNTIKRIRENAPPDRATNPENSYWEKRLEEKFSSPVKISKHGGRGKIVFHFYSDEEFNSLLDQLSGSEE